MYERRLAWRLFVAYATVALLALAALAWYGSYVVDEATRLGAGRPAGIDGSAYLPIRLSRC